VYSASDSVRCPLARGESADLEAVQLFGGIGGN
jgi:hypothetical protein